METKIIKTDLTVNTTSFQNPQAEVENGNANVETWYVGNGDFGIDASTEEFYGENCYEVKVFVSTMFPGTHQEWFNHIRGCVNQKAVEKFETGINVYGEPFLKF